MTVPETSEPYRPAEYDRAREAILASGTVTLNARGDVPCPVCGNEAHLHSGSGTRDCIATLTRVVAQLHRKAQGDD